MVRPLWATIFHTHCARRSVRDSCSHSAQDELPHATMPHKAQAKRIVLCQSMWPTTWASNPIQNRRQWVLNLRPLACWAGVIPLHHVPICLNQSTATLRSTDRAHLHCQPQVKSHSVKFYRGSPSGRVGEGHTITHNMDTWSSESNQASHACEPAWTLIVRNFSLRYQVAFFALPARIHGTYIFTQTSPIDGRSTLYCPTLLHLGCNPQCWASRT